MIKISILKLIGFFIHPKVLFQSIQFVSMCILSIGIYAFGGHMAHRESYYKWGESVGMAINTAVGFIFVGIVLFLITFYLRKIENTIIKLETKIKEMVVDIEKHITKNR